VSGELTIRRDQSERPKGHVGPVRFSFGIIVTMDEDLTGSSGDQTARARGLARADAVAWCHEMEAPGLVFQFETIENGWSKPGKITYTAYFGTGLMLEKGPNE
jgi:hypothetical protein